MHVLGKFLRDWWYLVPQSALDYPLELFVSTNQIVKAN